MAMWHHRHFTVMESRARAFGTSKDAFLGQIWLIVEPFLNAGVFYLIFAVVLEFDRGMENFVGYLVIGVMSFTLMTRSLSANTAIEGNGQRLAQLFSFPKASLILSYTLRSFIDFIPSFMAMLVFLVVMPPHAYPSPQWLLAPLIYALVFPMCMGIGMVAATAVVIVPDLRFLIGLLSRFWFYGSGIFWTVDMLESKPLLQGIMMLNPGWVFLETLRDVLLRGAIPAPNLIVYLGAWSFGLFALGLIVMWSAEGKMGKVLSK